MTARLATLFTLPTLGSRLSSRNRPIRDLVVAKIFFDGMDPTQLTSPGGGSFLSWSSQLWLRDRP